MGQPEHVSQIIPRVLAGITRQQEDRILRDICGYLCANCYRFRLPEKQIIWEAGRQHQISIPDILILPQESRSLIAIEIGFEDRPLPSALIELRRFWKARCRPYIFADSLDDIIAAGL